jgi:hypothetical protein
LRFLQGRQRPVKGFCNGYANRVKVPAPLAQPHCALRGNSENCDDERPKRNYLRSGMKEGLTTGPKCDRDIRVAVGGERLSLDVRRRDFESAQLPRVERGPAHSVSRASASLSISCRASRADCFSGPPCHFPYGSEPQLAPVAQRSRTRRHRSNFEPFRCLAVVAVVEGRCVSRLRSPLHGTTQCSRYRSPFISHPADRSESQRFRSLGRLIEGQNEPVNWPRAAASFSRC